MKKILLGALALISMTLFVACGSEKKESEAKAEPKVIRYNLGANPPQLDPQLTTDSTSGVVLGHLFEGLTKLDPSGKPVPGVAESWTNEGNIWTFKLRKDAIWHNGEQVVAGDFVASWERALNPKTASEYSYIFYSIKGAEEYNQEKIKDFKEVGIKAIDDSTIQVEVKEPVSYFASLVSFYSFLPQNQKFFNEHKDTYGSSVDDLLGNGSYKFVSWEQENKIILEKADTYWNKTQIKIDTIELSMITDASAALKAYQNDELDFTNLPTENFNEYKDSPEFSSWDDGSVWYLQFNTAKKPFNNTKIRQAISLAIDRKALVEKIKNNAGEPAESLVPSSIPGKKGFFRDDYPQSAYGASYNPEKAKKIFEEGLKELGIKASDIGTITLLTQNSDVATKETQFYQEQLRVNLGLDVKLEQVTYQIKVQKLLAKDYEFVTAGWGADYNDPMTYLDLWLSNSPQNLSNWSNAEFDDLIRKAKVEVNPEVRMDLMAKAEAIVIKEAPIATTFFRKVLGVQKPYVKDLVKRVFTPHIDFQYADIQK